jgi:hypothetical protein
LFIQFNQTDLDNSFPVGGYDALGKYHKKYETFVAPADGHNYSGEYLPQYHGTSGPIHITTHNYLFDSTPRIIAAAGSQPGFEFNQDVNSGYMLGVAYSQHNIGVSWGRSRDWP